MIPKSQVVIDGYAKWKLQKVEEFSDALKLGRGTEWIDEFIRESRSSSVRRIAEMLLALCPGTSPAVGFTQTTLAEVLGFSRTLTCNRINDLSRKGVVRMDGRSITITDRVRLAQIAFGNGK
jgi:CRP-like cAMP-binding protein